MEGFLNDLRLGFRSLFKKPAFCAVAVLTLAAGFGVNLTILSVAEAVLLVPLPYDDPERLVVLWRETEHLDRSSISFPTYFDWKERNRVFSRFSMLIPETRNLTGGEGDPERLEGLAVSADLLETLGLEPHLGRGFAPGDDRLGAPRTAMISHELWHSRFGGETAVVGRSITLDGERYAVIGVLPPGLSTEELGRARLGDVWLPVGLLYDELPVHERATRAGLLPVARLADGIDLAAARADMDRVARDLEAEHPLTNTNNRARLAPVLEDLVGDLRPTVLILMATVGFVLLIACANLVALLLTRFLARGRELAVRAALGASRGRLVRQGLTEAFAIAILGSLSGLVLAFAALRLLPVLLPEVPHADRAEVGPLVAAATIALCFLVTLLIGLVPALRTASTSWRPLETGARGSLISPAHQRLRQVLVAAELALALVLVIGAVLALDSFRNLRREKLGFSPEDVKTFLVSLPAAKYGDVAAWTGYFEAALESLGALPGIERVAVTSALPLGDGVSASRVLPGDRPIPAVPDMPVTTYHSVSPGFFELLGVPLLEGRLLRGADDDRLDAKRVAVINETLARQLWPDRSAVGRRVAFELDGTPADFEPRWREVVGVVGDVRYESPKDEPRNAVYVPFTQRPLWDEGSSPGMAVALESTLPLSGLMPAVRAELRKIDAGQPIYGVTTMDELVDAHLDHPRRISALLASFAGLAFALALVGIYGVVSYMVAARTREIGVRMALGARPLQELWRLLSRNFGLISAGIGAGLTLASGLTRLMASELYGVEAIDVRVFAGAAALLGAVAFLATLVPAARAIRVDTLQALRYE